MRSYGLDEFVDLNGDGKPDFLCIGNFAQHHEVLLNENGKLKEAWHYGWPESVTTGTVATQLAAARVRRHRWRRQARNRALDVQFGERACLVDPRL